MSTILRFKYYEIPCNVKKIHTGEILTVSHKDWAYKNLWYFAGILALAQVVIYWEVIGTGRLYNLEMVSWAKTNRGIKGRNSKINCSGDWRANRHLGGLLGKN